jgi:N-acyl-D-aspartate/D-glutamate deacylase
MLSRTFPIGPALDYEPEPSTSIAAQGIAQGRNPLQLALDLMLADGGKGMLLNTLENYNAGNLDAVREMPLDDATVMGVADGGAYVGVICDVSAGSCPMAWCKSVRFHYALRRFGGVCQSAIAGRLTVASSLSVAMVSSVI